MTDPALAAQVGATIALGVLAFAGVLAVGAFLAALAYYAFDEVTTRARRRATVRRLRAQAAASGRQPTVDPSRTGVLDGSEPIHRGAPR